MQSEYRRDFEVTATRAADNRTVELSFSSELPVSRDGYDEILSHDPKDCDLSRLNTGHPVLLNHDLDKVVGVVEKAAIGADKKGRALVRFGKSQLAEEIYQDVKAGIRKLCSVGYRLIKELSSERQDNGRPLIRFAWQPYEISLVAVPADSSVGIGRSNKEQLQIMTTTDSNSAELARRADIEIIKTRMSGKIPGCAEECDRALAMGVSVQALQDKLFTMMPGVRAAGRAILDIDDRTANQYSLSKAIMRAVDARDGKGRFDGLEAELSREMEIKSGMKPQGFWVPHTLLGSRADNTVGTATMGGNLVATNLLAGSFIDILRNRAWVAQLGARMLDGLVGNVVIPRQLAAATAYWTGEIIATTQSNTGFNQLTLTPKCVTGFEVYSKMLLLQSTPSVDNLIRDDLLKVLALAIDKAALVPGDGYYPTAICATTGISTVTCSTAGLIPTFERIIAMESAVALNNADTGNLAYLTNPAVRGALKTALKSTVAGSHGFIWEPNPLGTTTGSGLMNGYRSEVTNQLVANNTVGTLTTECSSLFFGNWSDLLIGAWGSTDITIDPYTNAQTREIRIFAANWIDLAVRNAKSFAWMPDALSA
jgi:HK97 family phage major capsid protein/HK97 family phage prohead protease